MKIFTFMVLLVLTAPVLIPGQTGNQMIDDRIEIAEKKMYVKGNFLFGLGFDKVLAAKKYYENKDDVDDMYIRPGGGLGVEGVFGYDITPAIAGEIGIGYQLSGESVSNGHVYFNKIPFRASILYKSARSIKQFSPYCGVGISMNLLTKYDWEEDDDKGSITYGNPAGFHGIAGTDFNPVGSPLYFSGEIRFVSMADYEVKSYKVNGSNVPISSVRTDFRKLGSSGLHFILTLGYYFN